MEPSQAEQKMKNASFPPKLQTPTRANEWTPQELEEATRILEEFPKKTFEMILGCGVDFGTVLAITQYMESISDLRLWLDSSESILQSAKTYGRFVADAKRWPSRRGAVREHAYRNGRSFAEG